MGPLFPTDVPPKHLRFQPIDDHQDSVPRAEAHAQICAAPEQERKGATAGEIAAQPGYISHGAFLADIRQAPLMGVLKRPNLFDTSQSLLQVLDGGENLITLLLVACYCLGLGQSSQLGVDLLGFGVRVKESGQKRSFLRRNLGGGCIVGNRWKNY